MAKPIHDALRQFMARTKSSPLCGPFFSVTVSSAAGGYIEYRRIYIALPKGVYRGLKVF